MAASSSVAASSCVAAAPAPELLMRTIRIVVGSTNPVKVAAVRDGFDAIFRTAGMTLELVVESVEAASSVSAQPMTDRETLRGARNRARDAAARAGPGACDFAVGVEGGCCDAPSDTDAGSTAGAGTETAPAHTCEVLALECMAWIAVLHVASGRWGTARTASFALPPAVAALVRSGVELGDADDRVFGRTDSKRKDGAVGLLTRGVIDRRSYYAHAVTLALIPFVAEDHY